MGLRYFKLKAFKNGESQSSTDHSFSPFLVICTRHNFGMDVTSRLQFIRVAWLFIRVAACACACAASCCDLHELTSEYSCIGPGSHKLQHPFPHDIPQK